MIPPYGGANPYDLVDPGATNAALQGVQVGWDAFRNFFTQALPSAWDHLQSVQDLGYSIKGEIESLP